jgi:hypothetical protein
MAAEMTANGQSADIAGAGSRLTISKSVSAQRLDQAGLGSRQQFRENSEVRATRGTDPQRRIHIDADHVSARRQSQLSLASQQQVPNLMLLLAGQGVLAVGTESPVEPNLATGAGQAIVAAGSTVFGPSARLEVPAAEGP